MAQIVVIGLGTFGSTVARELTRNGHQVIGIDKNAALVAALADDLTQVVTADATDQRVLDELGVAACDAALVAIGENIEASILATLLLKELNIPKVWVKAKDAGHSRILERLAADRIVYPEYEVGLRVAQQILHEGLEDFVEFGAGNLVLEIAAPPHLWNKTIADMPDVRVLAQRRGDLLLRGTPHAGDRVIEGDHLLVLGARSILDTFDLAAPRRRQ